MTIEDGVLMMQEHHLILHSSSDIIEHAVSSALRTQSESVMTDCLY